MKCSAGSLLFVVWAQGFFLTAGWAQTPLVKIWVTEVYEVNPVGTYTPKCGNNCPTQYVLPGLAVPGDLLNLEVTVEGWDADTSTGVCVPTGTVCDVFAQACPLSHCTSPGGTGAVCTDDTDCVFPSTCDQDVCQKHPLLGAFQWTLGSSTLSNGGTEPGLRPAVLACQTDTDCACAYTAISGNSNDCADFAASDPSSCTCGGTNSCQADNTCGLASVAYVDKSPLTNYVFFNHPSLTSVVLGSPNLEFAGVSTDLAYGGVPEQLFRCAGGINQGLICNVHTDCPGSTCILYSESPYYLGTLLLEVTDSACGLYNVDLVQDTISGEPVTTFILGPLAVVLPIPLVEPLLVDVGTAFPCDDGDPCTVNDVFCGGACAGTPIDCTPGACCLGTTCTMVGEPVCQESGGTYFGQGTTCNEPDADGDGLRDECDECPLDPGKIEPGICGCGLSDAADADGDTVPDCLDQCPGVDDGIFAPDCIGAIPTVSAWGLIILAMLLLIAGKIAYKTGRSST